MLNMIFETNIRDNCDADNLPPKSTGHRGSSMSLSTGPGSNLLALGIRPVANVAYRSQIVKGFQDLPQKCPRKIAFENPSDCRK